ncbi:MAG: phytoene desaturase family protein [Actinomycetota bacterium]
MTGLDAVVVGAGPNGLAAAVALARAGRRVRVIEGGATIGGGSRTLELTLPGFRHDVCAAVHPLGMSSPYFRTLPLEEHGLRWVQPPIPLAHPISPGEAVLVHRSVTATASGLGGSDGEEYRRRIEPLVERWDQIEPQILGPVLRLPRHPLTMARFGMSAVLPATTLLKAFRHEPAKALLAGTAAHGFLPLSRPLTSSFGLLYPITAHRLGWPFAAGGSQAIVDALASYLVELGGEIETGRWIEDLGQLPPAQATLLDVTPDVFERLAGARLPTRYRERLGRFRRAPAAYKVDYALSAPVPWINPRLSEAGTIHIGSSLSIVESERANWEGRRPQQPFMLVAQPSMFDPTRAPLGRHTLWLYAHVPFGSSDDFLPSIEEQIEYLAPGFKDRVLARAVKSPADLASYNPNCAGGDITGGAHTIRQLLFRPVPATNPYTTPLDGVYLCSSSTPPGAGVHGMCGYWAAKTALKRL